MGVLMTIGFLGMLGYMTYYTKQETQALVSDATLKPTNIPNQDKALIEKHFKMICKRGNAKIDKDGNPFYKEHYKPCVSYLEYLGFQKNTAKHFKKIYLEKYNTKMKNKIKYIKNRHRQLERLFYDEYDKKRTKILRYWHYGDTQKKCEKMMNNWLWGIIVNHYNIVKDGSKNVEVWTVSAPPSILEQIETIYDEVCFLEKIQ